MKRIVLFVLFIIMTTAVVSFATWPDPAPASTVNAVDQHRYDKPLLYGLFVGASMFLLGFVGLWALTSFPTPSKIALGLVISGSILMLMAIMTAICAIAAS